MNVIKSTRTVQVFGTHEKWTQILDELIDAGCSFYQMYGDVEIAVSEHKDGDEYWIELSGDDDAWNEFDAIIADVYTRS